MKSAFFEQGLNKLSLDEKSDAKGATICLKPPPPPAAPVSSMDLFQSSPPAPPSPHAVHRNIDATIDSPSTTTESPSNKSSSTSENADIDNDEFGDFQTAG